MLRVDRAVRADKCLKFGRKHKPLLLPCSFTGIPEREEASWGDEDASTYLWLILMTMAAVFGAAYFLIKRKKKAETLEDALRGYQPI